jgi:cephalosporin hydroxylase
MNYDMNDLITIAKRAVDAPWGVGDPILAKNSESWAPYLRFLHTVVKQYAPHVCLELGVYMGTATAHMALGCSSSAVLGVDRDYHPDAKANLERYPNVALFYGDTTSFEVQMEVVDFLDRLTLDAGKERLIGLLFLDSTHDGETPTREFQSFKPFFADECLVVCDDLLGPEHLKVKMQEFWEWLPGEKQEMHYLHPRLNTSYDEPGLGISIVRKDA